MHKAKAVNLVAALAFLLAANYFFLTTFELFGEFFLLEHR